METLWLILLIILGLVTGWLSTGGSKSQWVRLLDIFVYGPVLIYAATLVEPVWLQVLLVLFGATTIAYNLKNFLHLYHTQAEETDLIVVNPQLHTIFRFVAAFIVAPILIYKGWRYNDALLLAIGVGTLVIDLYTFSVSVAQK